MSTSSAVIHEVKPMSNLTFRLMQAVMYVWDIFLRHPRKDLERMPLKEGMTVVDYACGQGHYTIPLAQIVGPKGRVYAVDIQPLAVEVIRKKANRESLSSITAVLVDSYDTGIPDAIADVVLFIDALHYIADPDALFREIHRLLKPNGILCMDPGHLTVNEGRSIVERTGLFDAIRADGRNMQLTRRR
jgi:ubiquinone/menaquinone biosynthesis C-methylase UbiE